MEGGGSQQPSYNMGNSSSGSGWPPSSMGQNSQYNPFQMQSYTPQNQQSWQSMSPSFNAFSQLSAQGQQTPLTNQQGINAAMQQQTALQAAQPTSAPAQNFTLADANQTAGLPVGGQTLPAQQSSASIFNPPAPTASAASSNPTYAQFWSTPSLSANYDRSNYTDAQRQHIYNKIYPATK